MAPLLERLRPKRLFMVVDEAAYEASGAKKVLEGLVSQTSTATFTRFELNPKLEDVQRGIETYREFDPDFVISIGGGTAIDLAKLISSLAAQSESSRDIAMVELQSRSIASRPWRFLRRLELGAKLPTLPSSMSTGKNIRWHIPRYYRVCGSRSELDREPTEADNRRDGTRRVLSGYRIDLAVAATEESMRYATEAAHLAFHNLVAATQAPTQDVRRAMCRASHLAGKAINITKTTAPHALSYSSRRVTAYPRYGGCHHFGPHAGIQRRRNGR